MGIDRKIAMHCGPTLTGIKPANMLSISKAKNRALRDDITRLNQELNGFNIFFEILCECENRILLLVYNKRNLCEYINKREIADLLSKYGYPDIQDIDGCIEFLRKRIAEETEFPHEIGAFLGYPVEDIYGFIQHKNEGCMYTGYWRVYANVDEAKRLFSSYDLCRNRCIELIDEGANLMDVVMAS